jgi:hypothetical protein
MMARGPDRDLAMPTLMVVLAASLVQPGITIIIMMRQIIIGTAYLAILFHIICVNLLFFHKKR